MKPQETAQERAIACATQVYKGIDDVTKRERNTFALGHIAGEASGERITLERLAAKAGKGWEQWFNENRKIFEYGRPARFTAEVWQARGIPLLAKIELLEKQIKESEGTETNLPVILPPGFTIDADLVISLENLKATIADKGERIKTLESALVDMAKALGLSSVSGSRYANNALGTLERHRSLVSDLLKDDQ
jgi:hypothetical protein